MRSEKEIKALAIALRNVANNAGFYLRAEEYSMLLTRATTLEWVLSEK